MKNIHYFIEGVLTLCVAVLFYLHFSESKSGSAEGWTKDPNEKFAFVNVDTLLENYQLYGELKKEFEANQSAFESEMGKQKGALESEYMGVQEKAKNGQLSEVQMQMAEEKLMQKQQALMEFKEEGEGKLMEANQEITRNIFSKIQAYLKKMNEQTGYKFVFGYTREGGILLANDSLNITRAVIDGLNSTE